MTPKFEIIDARVRHCGQMSRILRHEHQAALMRLGVNTHRELRNTFEQSAIRRAWLIDGELSGLGGVTGSTVSPWGMVWVALSEKATRYPLQIVKEARRQLEGIMQTKQLLFTTIVGGDEAALRFAAMLGFHSNHDAEGAPAYSHSGRVRLMNYLRSDPTVRRQVGAGFVVDVGYHAEGAP